MSRLRENCPISAAAKLVEASYAEIAGVNHIDAENLPSKNAVGDICIDLLKLLFPGYHDDKPIATSDLSELTRRRVHSLADRLCVECVKAMRLEEHCPFDNIDEQTPELLCDFFKSVPNTRRILRTDVQAAYEGDPAAQNFDEIILAYPCIEAIAIQRLAHFFYKKSVPLIPRMMTEWAHSRTGIDIHPGAQIGDRFFIDHGTGVVIGETCRIGSGVKLYHGVTLGARSFPRDGAGRIIKGNKRHPDVEDNVTIYPNSTILGGDTIIGANATIGANVFVMHSVPPNTLVAFEPAKDYYRQVSKI